MQVAREGRTRLPRCRLPLPCSRRSSSPRPGTGVRVRDGLQERPAPPRPTPGRAGRAPQRAHARGRSRVSGLAAIRHVWLGPQRSARRREFDSAPDDEHAADERERGCERRTSLRVARGPLVQLGGPAETIDRLLFAPAGQGGEEGKPPAGSCRSCRRYGALELRPRAAPCSAACPSPTAVRSGARWSTRRSAARSTCPTTSGVLPTGERDTADRPGRGRRRSTPRARSRRWNAVSPASTPNA